MDLKRFKELLGEAGEEQHFAYNLEMVRQICTENGFNMQGDYVVLYHGTSPANNRKILKSGYLKSGTWLATDYQTAWKYGAMHVRRGQPVVGIYAVYAGALYFNGYFSTNCDLYWSGGVYKPRGLK